MTLPKLDGPCGCNRSLAVICALFASLAAAALLAEHRCRDAGGRVSDAAWLCELASGASRPLWADVSIGTVTAVSLLVGVPVYWIVAWLTTRPWRRTDPRP